jgi:type 1 glutamine amidotransferase
MAGPRRAHLVCGGKYHDFDYARLELLKLLAEDSDVRTEVAPDYRDVAALAPADFLVSYTCDVRPSTGEEKALAGFVAGGGRWLALHGTNAFLDFTAQGVAAPRAHPLLADVLGSQFVAHPPIQPYRVTIADPGHPLVAGIPPFETDDELYLCELHGERHALLETRFSGEAPGFVESSWPDAAPRPVMYLRRYERGEVLYLTLGHCRGRWDMRPVMPEYPRVERCSWELPVFRELLRRGLRWAGLGTGC